MTPAPTKEDFLALFEAVTPAEFSGPIKEHESYAMIRGLAEIFAVLARNGATSQQAAYFLPHANQLLAPASSGVRASGNVTLTRTGDLTYPIQIAPGEMRIVGSGQRVYVNVDSVAWSPDSPPETRMVVRFESEIRGYAGNLDHLADPSGNISLDHLRIVDQSQGRSNDGATILAATSGAVIQDTGVPDVFTPDDVGLYARITIATNSANVGRLVKILGFDSPGAESPPGSNRFPRRVQVGEESVAIPREVYRESSGIFTEITLATIAPSGSADVFETLYIATQYAATGVEITVAIAAEGVFTYVWEYWDGTAWQPLPGVDDPSDGFRSVGTFSITWSADITQVQRPSDISPNMWFAVRYSATPVAVTVAPQVSLVRSQVLRRLTPEMGTVGWQVHDFNDLGVRIVEAEAPTGGRDDDLYLLGDGRGLYQQDNESDDAFRQRAARLLDTLSPNAILRAANRALRPTGFEAIVQDVSSGLTGFFFDSDAFDYYEPGDVFPVDPQRLMLDEREAHGFFQVLVPFLGDGESGMFYDASPSLTVIEDEMLAGAFESGFFDGDVHTANSIYSAIYSSIDAIRAGGVGFTIVRSLLANAQTAC